jgi:small conductance mechanosensitive channel
MDMTKWAQMALDWLMAYGWQVVGAIAILLFGRIIVGFLTGIVRRLMLKAKIDETLTRFVTGLTKGLLMTFVFIAAVSALGVETTSLIAVLGAAGLAIGLALQASLSNFASGVMLIIFRPFKRGDYVEAGGVSGTVEEVAIFNTVLKTPDNRKVIVPNGDIVGGAITNYSAHETRRIDLVFGIGYDDDLRKAKATLERLVGEDSRILTDPAPTVAVSELADSSVNLACRPWVKSADYWDVRGDLIEKVKLTFDAEGISIPFPQQDVHMHTVEAPAA